MPKTTATTVEISTPARLRSRRKKALDESAPVVLQMIFQRYLRPYQVQFLLDLSRYRVVNKSRQIGFSDIIALEMVLVCSGLFDGMVRANNCNVISKNQDDANDVIERARKWVRALAADPAVAPYLVLRIDSVSDLGFAHSRFRIRSVAQSKGAGRGRVGHLYLDEWAHQPWQSFIWTGAYPTISSHPSLRVTVTSTPNGVSDHFHDLCTLPRYSHWSRHRVDLGRAIEEGFPADPDDFRRNCKSEDEYLQEYWCEFLGGEDDYFTIDFLLDHQGGFSPTESDTLILGVDTASIVDNTSIVCVWVRDDGNRREVAIGDCYLIQRTQYVTDHTRGRIGQDILLDALIQTLRPHTVIIDTTGNEGRRKQGQSAPRQDLFTWLINRHRGSVSIVPQHIDLAWKNSEVPELKTCLEAGQTLFATGRRDLVFTRKNSARYTRELGRIDALGLIQQCFIDSDFPVLFNDFRKVKKKWASDTTTTFATQRDADGHGDSLWGAVLAHSVARRANLKPRTGQTKYRRPTPKKQGGGGISF